MTTLESGMTTLEFGMTTLESGMRPGGDATKGGMIGAGAGGRASFAMTQVAASR